MDKRMFGTLDTGEDIYVYTLDNGLIELDVMNFGARLVALRVDGTDIIGGFDTLEGYIADDTYQGGTIGRVANRVGGACFTMDGREYKIPDNDGGNCLHGGCGFDRRVWTVTDAGKDHITLSYISAHGEEGFPASVKVKVTYTLVDKAVRIDYEAVADGKTPISLTNHAYFNIDGLGASVLGQTVRINADRYTAVGADLIPTGERPEVTGTPMDLREGRIIRDALCEGIDGFDHNFILNSDIPAPKWGDNVKFAAEVRGERLVLRVYTDQPGVQFYTGNFLGSGPDFKGGIKQIKHGALCLETQVEPNCIKHGESIYGPTDIYRQTTVYEIEKIENIH